MAEPAKAAVVPVTQPTHGTPTAPATAQATAAGKPDSVGSWLKLLLKNPMVAQDLTMNFSTQLGNELPITNAGHG